MLGLSSLAIVAGFALLVWAADRFVLGASATARNLGVSPLIIGLTIVGFGTSAPEMLVSAVAAWNGNPEMGLGNALGSNITNVALVLGATAIIAPLSVHSETLRREFPILFAIMLLALALILDGELGQMDGIVLLMGMGVMMYWMVSLGMREYNNSSANTQVEKALESTDPLANEYADEIPEHMPMWQAIGWVVIGLIVLLASSRLLLWGAVNIAEAYGVSDLIIGLTIIAIGTSLPELAASVMSALKNEHDIAIGNVLGSNMFNLLAVMGLPGLIQPHSVSAEVYSRDYPVMIGLAVALFAMAYGFRHPGKVTRQNGVLLLVGYFAYLYLLYRAATTV